MKMRRRKFGIGLKIASLLTTIAVVSVGLASWVITVPTQEVTAAGTITVDDVTTKQVTLTAEWVNVTLTGDTITGTSTSDDPVIYYGAPNKSIEGAWLTNDKATADDPQYENLTAWLKITAVATGMDVPDLAATLTAMDGEEVFDLSTAVVTYGNEGQKRLVGDPTLTVYTTTDGTNYTKSSLAANKITAGDAYLDQYLIKIEFKWGEAFGGINAYEYFNANAYSAAKATEATTKLSALQTALSDITYKMTIGEATA